jgi:hypothetical protein
MNTKRLTRSTAIGLALTALAAPAAAAQQDLRNADQVSPPAPAPQALREAGQLGTSQDLRNADQVAPAAIGSQDMRSPDAIDATAGRDPSPEVVYVEVPSAAPAEGLDWADAGIGAGGLLGLGLIAFGGTLVAVRRRHAAAVR